MANKRILKKQIRYICGDVAAECIMSKIFIPGVNQEKFNDIVIKIAELQTTALARTNVAFDKAPRDFESGAAYRKARKQYFAKAFSAFVWILLSYLALIGIFAGKAGKKI